MFASLDTTRSTLNSIALEFDAAALSPEAALRVVDQLGAIRRVVDGMLGKAAARVASTNTSAHDASGLVARVLGVSSGEVRDAITTAKRLETLPATDAAVRHGRLSAREAALIAGAAAKNPAAEANLLGIAEQGLVPLRDACVKARAAVEDPDGRAQRQHRRRAWHSWTDPDGMVAGRFRFTPEVGGQVQAVIDAEVKRIFRARQAGTDHEPLAAYAADAVAGFVLDATSHPPNTVSDTPVSCPPLPAHGLDVHVHIVIDHGALVRGGTVDGEICEIPGVGPVDVSWVKALIGSAFLTAVIKRGKDILTVAHLGRHVPAEVITALIVNGRECDIDGCNHRGYLERDHRHGHAQGGPTSYKNLGWLCYRHHRLKSAGWTLGPPHPITRKRALHPPDAQRARNRGRSMQAGRP